MPSRQPGDGRSHHDQLVDDLVTAAGRAGYDWWWTPAARSLVSTHPGPLVTALDGLGQVLREGHDPDVVTGGPGPRLAVEVAGEWLSAGVEAGDVAVWLRAGCWRPQAARLMADAGIRPHQLVTDDGSARHLVDSVSGWPVPLARAVADDEMSPRAALAYLREVGDTHHVRVEQAGRGWRVTIDGVAVVGVAHLGEVEEVSRDLIAADSGGDPDEIHVVADVRLPPSVQARLEAARAPGPCPARACAELEAAACELAAMGVGVADLAEILGASTRAVHGLLRHRADLPSRTDRCQHHPA